MNLLEHAHRCAYQSGDIPTRRAHTVHQLATLLTKRLPVTLEAMRLEFVAVDGFATDVRLAGVMGKSGTGISKPVERTVILRDRDGHGITPDHNDLSEHVLTASDVTNRAYTSDNPDDIDDWLNVATIALRQAHRICDRHNKPTDPHAPRALRCQGTGDASGAQCEQIADYRIGDNGVILHAADGRCLDCRVAVERAEMEAERQKLLARETRRRTMRRR